MSDFVIMTDSSCDLPAKMADELELVINPLSVIIEGREYVNYLDEREISFHDYYEMLRAGKMGTTSACNTKSFIELMQPILESGRDILYLGFSSALSGTFSAGESAGAELRSKYPDRKIYTVDTLCASMGQGLIVQYAVQEKRKGKTIEEVRDFVEENKLTICHLFTVNDLHHLKRGGRISATTAIAGTLLQIKPIMYLDDDGRLAKSEKAKGRRAAIRRLAEKMEEAAVGAADRTVFISHADCPEDAELFQKEIRERMDVKEIIIGYVGLVIGTHTGPDMLAVFFMGKER